MTGKPVRARTRALIGACLALASVYATTGQVIAKDGSANRLQRPAATPSAASDCGSGVICLWGQQSFDGEIFVVAHQTNGWSSLVGSFNDRARSFVNNKALDARLAENANGSGNHHCLPAATQQSTMGSFNGEASAIYVYGNNDICNN